MLGGVGFEVGFLWEVLPEKTVRVLVRSALPGRVRVREEHVNAEQGWRGIAQPIPDRRVQRVAVPPGEVKQSNCPCFSFEQCANR